MGLDARDCDTIRTAASLSQMGKLFVPRDLLTKSGQLTPDEQAEIMLAPQHAYDVLRDIDFGLPVAQAVYEMNERMDGKGYPQHLSGEAISMHARVLSVVNAFCAMVSPRSYRSGMPVNTALDRLRTDSSFDQQVVDALGLILRTPEGLSIATPMQDEAKA
jgi:HD-GYP domain-containing protein (c-di-GMP phosphodiesterase class II)